jgi:uncharacterized coiled-coil protein SlyX
MNVYEKLRKQVSEVLVPNAREIGKGVADICGNFKMLGLETAVWRPEKIHSANLGGIEADTYLGYARIEGRWGLAIRTIERDQKSGEYIGQRIATLESCNNLEILANSLEEISELVACIQAAIEHQAGAIDRLSSKMKDLQRLRNDL